MRKNKFIIFSALLLITESLAAQAPAGRDSEAIVKDTNLAGKTIVVKRNTEFIDKRMNSAPSDQKNNLIKLNVTSLIFKTISLQYERVLTHKTSATLSVSLLPTSGLPLKSIFLNAAGDNEDAKKAIDNFRLSIFSLTPEYRFYFGKGYGKGFYLAPFYRYTHYTTKNLSVDYTADNGDKNNINLAGTINCHTGGVMIGAQWYLGKRMCLDWWIFGPHYGVASGQFEGVAAKPLTDSEQADIRKTVNNIDIPIIDKTIATTSRGATLNLDGPWAGIGQGFLLESGFNKLPSLS